MQTAQILPRDILTHYVTAQEGKQIAWNFTVRKKTINFGLYLQRNPKGKASPRLNPSDLSNGSIRSLNLVKITSTKSKDIFDREKIPTDEDHHDVLLSPHSSSSGRKSTSMTGGAISILTDPNMIEIIPIENYEADKDHRGTFTVKETGRYCIVFDNTFSRNTSKMVTFLVTVQDNTVQTDEKVDIEGWMLKKRRKKMQGWAKRWFTLKDGMLTYRLFPNSPSRGSIEIGLAAVASNPAQNSIHIDSGQQIWHLRALTKLDFDKWMPQIRHYLIESAQQQFEDMVQQNDSTSKLTSSNSHQHHNGARSSVYRMSMNFAPSDGKSEVPKIYSILGDMDNQFREIRKQLDMMNVYSSQRSVSNPGLLVNDAKVRIKSAFAVLRGSEQNGKHSKSQDVHNINKDGIQSLESIHGKLDNLFVTLKNEKEELFELLRDEVDRWKLQDLQYRSLIAEKRDVSQFGMNKNLDSPADRITNIGKLALHTAGNMFQKMGGLANDKDDYSDGAGRSSSNSPIGRTMSISSGRSSVFFDAEEIALPGDISTDDDDDDICPQVPIVEESEEDADNNSIKTSIEVEKKPLEIDSIQRREQLPHPIAGDEVSIFSLLRKNVGKDLSTVSMPISLNEPLNALQRLAEELEYSELLDKAATCNDSLGRLICIAAFAISGYSSTQHRAGRKPFNPLLGETYECVRPDKGFKYIAEKVVHHPPIMACHAEHELWEFYQDSQAKNKFWGKSMEIVPEGTTHIILKATGDHFAYNRPSSWMRNLVAGTKYLEHTGQMMIINQTTMEKCEITFHESSLWNKDKNNMIEGIVFDSNGKKTQHKLEGKWTSNVSKLLIENKDQYEVLWRCNEFPRNCAQYYGFSKFAVELNEITDDIKNKLAPTDTRLRPDQRLLEDGDVERADNEKRRLEQKQRDARQRLEEEGKIHEPRYFKLQEDEWVFKGNYWKNREVGDWNDALDLF